ncbi:MAG: hypothetical protein NVS3B20_20700 [Polyangiales bacterium]
MPSTFERRARNTGACRAIVALVLLWVMVNPRHAQGASSKFTRGPYLQDLTSREVAVLCELDSPHAVTVEVSRGVVEGSDAPKVFKSASTDAAHEIVLAGLEPATSYRYVVRADDGLVERGTFTTAPEDDRPFSFLFYGDNRTDAAAHAEVVKGMRDTLGDFLIQSGDMVNDGSSPTDWLNFFAIEHQLLRDRCIFPAIGNHEIAVPTSDGALRYARLFRVPSPRDAGERWYTFRWGMARFFMLDAQDDFSSTERTWLEAALKAADDELGIVFRFAVMHHGPYSSGPHRGHQAAVLARIPELLRAHKIDILLAGQDHTYERGDALGLRYLSSGGGGAPLYKQDHEEPSTQRYESVHHFVKIALSGASGVETAIRADGSIIERCTFQPGGAMGWDCGGSAPSPSSPPSPLATIKQGDPAKGAERSSFSRACGCAFLRSGPQWIGIAAGVVLAVIAFMRRRGRPNP